MGSDSDLDIMREAAKALDDFGIAYEIDVTSAHRSPERTAEFARKAASHGIKVIIAGAGGAAHLAGVIAAHTTLPVIGVPIPSTALNGLDSLLATVQMPAGIPVATVAIGKPGATNAGILAAQILGLAHDVEIRITTHHDGNLWFAHKYLISLMFNWSFFTTESQRHREKLLFLFVLCDSVSLW